VEFHPLGGARPVAKQVGPPAHAPAHGYRQKHPTQNVDLVYDTNIGCYVVVGHAGVYFNDGLYFRLAGDNWQVTASLNDEWRMASARVVPKGLKNHKNKQAKNNPGKGNGRGNR
jgi:hypothetical protein